MIFTPHIVVGATIGAKTQNLGLIVILGLITHFVMDKVPHWDYVWLGIKKFRKDKDFKALFSDLLKIAVDCTFGLLIVFFVLWYKGLLDFNYLPFILFGIFFSTLPDIILGLAWFLPKKSVKKFINFTEKYLHYPEDKQKEGEITFLGLATEIIVVVICVFLLSL